MDLDGTVFARSRSLKLLVNTGSITLAGNAKLKIYGTLHCKSGMRMKDENRVFFATQEEAITNGYRPCGNCMNAAHKKWKDGLV